MRTFDESEKFATRQYKGIIVEVSNPFPPVLWFVIWSAMLFISFVTSGKVA